MNPNTKEKKINKEEREILENFIRKVIEQTEDIDEEFVSLVDENFWDLI